MDVQSSILWDTACSYTCEGVAVRNASTTMQANNYTEAQYINPLKSAHSFKWNRSCACDKVWCESVSSCATYSTYVREGENCISYDGVQVYVHNNASVCTSA